MDDVTQTLNLIDTTYSLSYVQSAEAVDCDKDMERGTGKRGHESGERADGNEVVSSLKRHSKIRKRSKRCEHLHHSKTLTISYDTWYQYVPGVRVRGYLPSRDVDRGVAQVPN